MTLKRFFDVSLSSIGLLILAPLFVVLSLLIKIDSRGPVIYTQERVGLHGKTFRVFKFRTMFHVEGQTGNQLTVGGDPRITRIGHFLRRTKLDELPQLANVWIGHMSLVGPRPEVPCYIQYYDPNALKHILSVRPGMTDLASIHFKSESDILARSADPQMAYILEILPIKCNYYLAYANNNSLIGDILIITATLKALIFDSAML